jgi:Holliday junction resolvase RusA-like endonuclease
VIEGEPASKANARQIVMFGTRPAVIKSRKAREYARTAALQVPVREQLLHGPLRATIRIWYASERPDLDESIVLDVLQGRVYRNDRQVRERHVYHGIDRARPRAEVTIEPLRRQVRA